MPDCRVALAGGDVRVRSQKVLEGCDWTGTLNLTKEEIVSETFLRLPDGEDDRGTEFFQIAEGLAFIPLHGNFARISDPARHLLSCLYDGSRAERWMAAPAFSPASHVSVTASQFNEECVRWEPEAFRKLVFSVDGVNALPGKLCSTVSISIVHRRNEKSLLAGIEAPETWLKMITHEIRKIAEGFRRLLAARSRRIAVGAIIWRVLGETDARRSDRFDSEVAGCAVLTERWQIREAWNLVSRVASRFRQATEGGWIEVAACSSPRQWRVRESKDFGKALAAAGIVYRHCGIPFDPLEPDHLKHPLEVDVSLSEFERVLGSVYGEAEAMGISVLIDEQPLRYGDLEIAMTSAPEVAAGSSSQPDADPDKIDWFELRPEIRCAGFTLTESQWVAILTTGLFHPPDDGPPLVVRTEALERLRTFCELNEGLLRQQQLPKSIPPDVKDDVRQVRLEVLDWLNLTRAGIELRLKPADQAVLDALLGHAEPEPYPVPRFLNANLRAYQTHGFRWMSFLYKLRLGAVLADDMGLGKTLQTIAFLASRKESETDDEPGARRDPHLVVLPPTLVFNWQAELRRFYPRFRVYAYVGDRRDARQIGSAEIVLTTYDTVRRDIEHLKKQRFDAVIFDEAQTIKNYRSSRARAARQLQAKFRLCLTGTPVENHLGEYFSIIDLALPRLLGEYRDFLQAVKSDPEAPQLKRATPFLLRRKKEGLLTELPPLVESDIYLDLSDFQKELYTRTVAEVREEIAAAYATKPLAQAGIAALAALTRLRLACIDPLLLVPDAPETGPKMRYLRTALCEIVEEGHAALVFSQFTRALDLLGSQLRTAGIPYLRLDGRTPRHSRGKLVADFQDRDGAPVFLISLRAGATGLNLTRASYVFHLDPWWNPAVEEQATGRAYRFGQSRSVALQRLLMNHTVEQKMMELKSRKKWLYARIMDSAEARSAVTLTTAQITDLLT